MKTLNDQALNRVNIVGKLLDSTVNAGVLNDGSHYLRANINVRVTQTYNGREETSEVPVSMFAKQFTSKNNPNPGYEQIQNLSTLPTVQNVGYDSAATVRLSGANIRENNFVARSGRLVNGWQINSSFIGTAPNGDETASFTTDLFIMDMHDEEDANGDTTGRLVVKGAIVQFGQKLDVVEFIVENPEHVDYISRRWNVNDTVTAKGRIRVTSKEVSSSRSGGGWGEDIPEATTIPVRELIITTGDDEGKEEDFAYDPVEIKKGFKARKARIEQMQVQSATKTDSNTSKYSWE